MAAPIAIGVVDVADKRNARMAAPIAIGVVDVADKRNARMAELVDALVSNTNIARCAGSTPAPGTFKEALTYVGAFLFL